MAKSVPSLEEEVRSVREKEKALTEQLAKAGRELDEVWRSHNFINFDIFIYFENFAYLGLEMYLTLSFQSQANAPPTVQQLRSLQHKLATLEQKHNNRVLELENTVQKLER